MGLELLEGLGNEISQIGPSLLPVIDLVPDVIVLSYEYVEHRQDLAVVGDQGPPHQGGPVPVVKYVALDQGLQNLEDLDDDGPVPSVEGGLNGDDELRDDGQDLGAPHLHHVVHSPLGEEGVRFLHLPKAVEEYGEVVMKVEPVDGYLPGYSIVNTAMIYLDRKVSPLVEATELRVGGVGTLHEGLELDGAPLAGRGTTAARPRGRC